MRLGLICVGRLKAGPERELYQRYSERIFALRRLGLEGLELREIEESRAKLPAERMAREAEEILSFLPQDSALLMFDETGLAADSLKFADFIKKSAMPGEKRFGVLLAARKALRQAFRRALRLFFHLAR